LEEDNVPILEAGRMKTEEDKMCSLENIRSKCFFTNIYIYKGIFVYYSLAGTGIYGYEYYDTRTRPVNIWVSKIPIPADCGYPFLIFVSYPLRVLSADTRRYEYF